MILKEDRTIDYLKETVRSIYKALRQTVIYVKGKYPFMDISLPKTISFITSQELDDMYPDLSPKERERMISKEKGAVFIIGIGDTLKSGIVHDLRSPDYDDWSLDGDLLVYDKKLDKEVEITSMGIRVDEKSLVSQLEKAGCSERMEYPYHQMILKKKLPYTIGGGIGVSRVLLFMLQKSHIVEVQSSSWTSSMMKEFDSYQIL